MERGATASCLFKFPEEVKLNEIVAMRLYIRGTKGKRTLTKELSKGEIIFLSENEVQVDFSQEDTLGFRNEDNLELQWHWRDSAGAAKTSKIIKTYLYEFLGSEPV